MAHNRADVLTVLALARRGGCAHRQARRTPHPAARCLRHPRAA
ncbi:hypothetical protein, partial [Xanthomonas arboricola]